MMIKNSFNMLWLSLVENKLNIKTVLVLFFVRSYWRKKFRRKVSCTAETPCKAV